MGCGRESFGGRRVAAVAVQNHDAEFTTLDRLGAQLPELGVRLGAHARLLLHGARGRCQQIATDRIGGLRQAPFGDVLLPTVLPLGIEAEASQG